MAKLRSAPRARVGELELAARRQLVLSFVAMVRTLNAQIKDLERAIRGQVRAHPDGAIFLSLFKSPNSVITAAELLSEIGDCRERYPDRDALVAHLEAHAPWGARVSVQPGAVAAPFTARSDGRAYRCARSALGEAWGTPAVDAGAGGSIPFVTAYAGLFPDAEILITGVEDPGTRAHGSNESLHLATFERACLAEALLLRNLAGDDD